MFDDGGDPQRMVSAPFATLLARDDWPVLVGLPALAAVFMFAGPGLGWWAAAVAVVVYSAGFVAFGRSRAAHDTYDELITVLGRLPEIEGLVDDGHAERTAALAVTIGRSLGQSPSDLALLDAAARCRSVGAVGRDEPPHARPGFDDRAQARWSRDIVAAAPRLVAVAELVGPVEGGPLRPVLDIAAAYDDATVRLSMTPGDALVWVGNAWSAQPEVVAALAAAIPVDEL